MAEDQRDVIEVEDDEVETLTAEDVAEMRQIGIDLLDIDRKLKSQGHSLKGMLLKAASSFYGVN